MEQLLGVTDITGPATDALSGFGTQFVTVAGVGIAISAAVFGVLRAWRVGKAAARG